MNTQELKRLVNSDEFKDILDTIKVSYFDAWQESSDVGEREQIHAKSIALDDLVGEIKAIIHNQPNQPNQPNLETET